MTEQDRAVEEVEKAARAHMPNWSSWTVEPRRGGHVILSEKRTDENGYAWSRELSLTIEQALSESGADLVVQAWAKGSKP